MIKAQRRGGKGMNRTGARKGQGTRRRKYVLEEEVRMRESEKRAKD